MKNYPLVSVIIPNYKRVYELKRSLHSVILQSYQNIEIFIIDDCSPNIDEIKNVLNTFDDKRVVLIEHEINKGGGAARNTGILRAKGKYIAFLDSDDTWEKEKISKQVLEAEKHTDNLLVYTETRIHRKTTDTITPERGIRKDELISEYLFVNGGFIPTPSIFVTTSLAKECLFNEEFPRHQDYDFLFKLEKKKVKIIFLDEVLVNVFWTSDVTPVQKGWTPEFSIKFFDLHKNQMTGKSYAHAYFIHVVSQTRIHRSKIESLKYLFKKIKIILYLNKILLMKYFIKLILNQQKDRSIKRP